MRDLPSMFSVIFCLSFEWSREHTRGTLREMLRGPKGKVPLEKLPVLRRFSPDLPECGGGELRHVEALAAAQGAGAAVLLAGLERALVVGRRRVLEAQGPGGLAQHEVGEVREVAHLHHRKGE